MESPEVFGCPLREVLCLSNRQTSEIARLPDEKRFGLKFDPRPACWLRVLSLTFSFQACSQHLDVPELSGLHICLCHFFFLR